MDKGLLHMVQGQKAFPKVTKAQRALQCGSVFTQSVVRPRAPRILHGSSIKRTKRVHVAQHLKQPPVGYPSLNNTAQSECETRPFYIHDSTFGAAAWQDLHMKATSFTVGLDFSGQHKACKGWQNPHTFTAVLTGFPCPIDLHWSRWLAMKYGFQLD